MMDNASKTALLSVFKDLRKKQEAQTKKANPTDSSRVKPAINSLLKKKIAINTNSVAQQIKNRERSKFKLNLISNNLKKNTLQTAKNIVIDTVTINQQTRICYNHTNLKKNPSIANKPNWITPIVFKTSYAEAEYASDRNIAERKKAVEENTAEAIRSNKIKWSKALNTTKFFETSLTALIAKNVRKSLEQKKSRTTFIKLKNIVAAVYWNVKLTLRLRRQKSLKLLSRSLTNKITQFATEMVETDNDKSYEIIKQRLRNMFSYKTNYVFKRPKNASRWWLKRYFPKYYNLYSVDPQNYYFFRVRRRSILRSQPATINSTNYVNHESAKNVGRKYYRRFQRRYNWIKLSRQWDNILNTTVPTQELILPTKIDEVVRTNVRKNTIQNFFMEFSTNTYKMNALTKPLLFYYQKTLFSSERDDDEKDIKFLSTAADLDESDRTFIQASKKISTQVLRSYFYGRYGSWNYIANTNFSSIRNKSIRNMDFLIRKTWKKTDPLALTDFSTAYKKLKIEKEHAQVYKNLRYLRHSFNNWNYNKSLINKWGQKLLDLKSLKLSPAVFFSRLQLTNFTNIKSAIQEATRVKVIHPMVLQQAYATALKQKHTFLPALLIYFVASKVSKYVFNNCYTNKLNKILTKIIPKSSINNKMYYKNALYLSIFPTATKILKNTIQPKFDLQQSFCINLAVAKALLLETWTTFAMQWKLQQYFNHQLLNSNLSKFYGTSLLQTKKFVTLFKKFVIQKKYIKQMKKKFNKIFELTQTFYQRLIKMNKIVHINTKKTTGNNFATKYIRLQKYGKTKQALSRLFKLCYIRIISNISKNLTKLSSNCFVVKKGSQQSWKKALKKAFTVNKTAKKYSELLKKIFSTAKKDYAHNTKFDWKRSKILKIYTAKKNRKKRAITLWLKYQKFRLVKRRWKLMDQESFKKVRNRLRTIAWKESDKHFYRPTWRKANRFSTRLRKHAEWFEPLVLTRKLYHRWYKEYRQRKIAKQRGSLKWLQYYKQHLLYFRKPNWIDGRKRYRLKTYMHRLFHKLFNFKNRREAQKHFAKKMKRSDRIGFNRLSSNILNRLDITLLILRVIPTQFWARELIEKGLIRINGKIIYTKNYYLQPGDVINWNFETLKTFRPFFKRYRVLGGKNFYNQPAGETPKNILYYPLVYSAIYLRLPKIDDIPLNSYVNSIFFLWFGLESSTGR
jgi:ribosomal protein S4